MFFVIAVRLSALMLYVLGMHVVPMAHAYAHQLEGCDAHKAVESAKCTGCCQNHPVKSTQESRSQESPSQGVSFTGIQVHSESGSHHCTDECQLCQVLSSTFANATATPGFTITIATQEAPRAVVAPAPIDFLLYVPGPRGPPCA